MIGNICGIGHAKRRVDSGGNLILHDAVISFSCSTAINVDGEDATNNVGCQSGIARSYGIATSGLDNIELVMGARLVLLGEVDCIIKDVVTKVSLGAGSRVITRSDNSHTDDGLVSCESGEFTASTVAGVGGSSNWLAVDVDLLSAHGGFGWKDDLITR